MMASVVVVSFNSRADLDPCLRRLLAIPATPDIELLVVDNASSDDSVEIARRLLPPESVVRLDRNLGFGGAINAAAQTISSDFIAVLNPDVEVSTGWLHEILAPMIDDSAVGIVGSKLLYPDGRTIQHAGGIVTSPLGLTNHHGYGELDDGQYDLVREVDYVTGAAFAVRRSCFVEVGGFDEGFFPAYFEETDLCTRVRRSGYKVVYAPESVAIHHEGATTGTSSLQYFSLFHRNRIRYVLKNYSDVQLWSEFLPAEIERAHALMREDNDEGHALRQAYADTLAILDGDWDLFANPAQVASLGEGSRLRRLIDVLIQSTMSPESPEAPLKKTTLAQLDDLHQRLESLAAKSRVREQPFESPLPIVGPAVVRFRQLWNWMSTIWYVRPLVQQQNDFNQALIDFLLYVGNFSTTALDEAAERAFERCRHELAAVTRRQDDLERAVNAHGDLAIEADRLGVRHRTEIARLDLKIRSIAERLAIVDDLASDASSPRHD